MFLPGTESRAFKPDSRQHGRLDLAGIHQDAFARFTAARNRAAVLREQARLPHHVEAGLRKRMKREGCGAGYGFS